tara:strand:- start:72 stop:665 length:594 start_codon:yes stop_codon:yes gene_type:complete
MYKLGITGGMGSGKSTASVFFKDKGALVFDADLEAKKLITNNSTLKKQIISAFGTEITADNQLDLKKLADVVFSTEKHQKSLNDIVWPEVSNVMKNAAKNAENDEAKLFIVDAALLLEAEFNEFFNSILLITADKSVRYKRIQKRKNIPEDQIEKRMALQMPESKKKKLAHAIIENNGNLSKLHEKLGVFWKSLNVG